MNETTQIPDSNSTETKIKEAARRVFMKKGYAATRTRDIAEESGFNLALINYYFRSKSKLFDIIMLENMQLFSSSLLAVFNNRDNSINDKLEQIVDQYIDMFLHNPDMPLFVLRELNENPQHLLQQVANRDHIDNVFFLQQWKDAVASGEVPDCNPLHLLINLVSLTAFPFITGPLLRAKTKMNMEEFKVLMTERKKLIPIWLKAMFSNDASK